MHYINNCNIAAWNRLKMQHCVLGNLDFKKNGRDCTSQWEKWSNFGIYSVLTKKKIRSNKKVFVIDITSYPCHMIIALSKLITMFIHHNFFFFKFHWIDDISLYLLYHTVRYTSLIFCLEIPIFIISINWKCRIRFIHNIIYICT
jgi:hypothetical protein